MKNITLDKLRTLAAAVADAEQGSKAWDKATDALSAKFSPLCLVTLIDRLQAALRDAQQLEAANISLDAESCKFRQRAEAAEAELKRRDAQEPVGVIRENPDDIGLIADFDVMPPAGTNLYAATTAAVLPTDIVITAEIARVGGLVLKESDGEYQDDAARRVFNAMLAAATTPGGGDV
ncbi:hypothetical protein [Erwinia sp. S38]|uniref:hypothetical protein n=1 Tax=Erwinia sp. S38 TaxID=2769338 RepID=UPI00190C608B|nr:hypothetical protein [Erwinia sp. S38]MBK0003392.1 hypothetical protein [Erwinia sp. S38]